MNGEVAKAASAAQAALEDWSQAPMARRQALIEKVAAGYRENKSRIAEAICQETGKPRWEAAAEVEAMIAKAGHAIAAQQARAESSRDVGGMTAGRAVRAIGVLGVLGPFNMPGHLPNGHLMPAALAGNTVVFKPSELTPRVGELMAEFWRDAPAGVFNLVQGGAGVGMALVTEPSVDGILFTGSAAAGAAIHRALAGHPEKLLALEMGGNNPLIVWDSRDLDAAAYMVVQSAFITSGQRCSCARRLIVRDSAVLERVAAWMGRIRVGLYSDTPEPFMGPVISAAAADRVLAAQVDLVRIGGKVIVEMKRQARSPALLTPGLIDVTGTAPADEEIFGPLLQVIRVTDFATAIAEANKTRYGLAAGLLSDSTECAEIFRRTIRAGVVHVNRPTTGARSDLPFGGLKASGNHRASAYDAAEYCSDPVAVVQAGSVAMPAKLAEGITP